MAALQNPPDSQSVQPYCRLHHHCHRHHHRPCLHHAFPNACICSHHHLHHSGYAPHGYYAPPPIAARPPFFYPLTLPLTYPPIAAPSNPTINLSSSGYPAENVYYRSVEGEPDAQELIEEEDHDEEPIYVLTDEWREFFAKSEARRKEAKKQARKQRK